MFDYVFIDLLETLCKAKWYALRSQSVTVRKDPTASSRQQAAAAAADSSRQQQTAADSSSSSSIFSDIG
jgi:hypothetical protein